MKKMVSFWAIAVLILSFAACSKDKDQDSMAGRIAGIYTGTITVTLEDGSELGAPLANQNIYVNATGEHTVDLELKIFEFNHIPVGDLKVSGVWVSEDGRVSGSATEVPIMEGAMKADLTVSGTARDNQANFLFVVNAPLAPGGLVINMNVTFTGHK